MSVINLKDLRYNNKYEVGGKAASLGELINLGFNVPKGFVCTSVKEAEVMEYYKRLNLNSVAVRSSAICEDSAKNSFAGQFETILNVNSKDLIKSVNLCYNSNICRNVKEYASERTVDNKDTRVSVIVQEMINGDISGVIFTKNPISDANEIMLEYVSGLGEKLVQGEVTPTQIIVDKSNLEILNIYNDENLLLINDLKILCDIAIKIEKSFGIAQDIEWTMKENEIFILQARPITTVFL